jgi:hypothetical protein
LLILAGVTGLLIHSVHIYNVPDGDWGIAILSPISFTYCSTHGGFGRKVEIVKRPGCNFYPSPHAMGCGASRSLRYDPGFFSFSREILATGTKDGQLSKYFLTREAARAICNRSKIIEDTVYVYPLRAVVDRSDTDAIAVSEDGGGKFDLRAIPQREEPPILIDQNGVLVSGKRWETIRVEFIDAKRVNLFQRNYLRQDDDKRTPIIERHLESQRAGKSWMLVEYKLLRSDLLPTATSILLQPAEFVFNEHAKAYQVKDVTKLSLGH